VDVARVAPTVGIMLDFVVRPATCVDAEVIAWHRVRMFQDMGMVPDHLFESFRAISAEWVRASLASAEYIGWLVPDPEAMQKIIAGAGVMLRPMPPVPLPDACGQAEIYTGRQGLVVNVFTEPAWRRRGLARLLLEQIIAWSHQEGIESVVLHASDDGRRLYEQLGFRATNEMRLSV
jgi:GNAT superfamily N-acetyltransferase